MKKVMALLLAGLLMLTSCAQAVGTADLTLREKALNQLFKSGLRGAMKLIVSGDGEWAQTLAPVSGLMLQFRAISGGDEGEFEIYAENNGAQAAFTHLYHDKDSLLVKTDMLLDTVLRMPYAGDWYSGL